jgi:ribosome maturation factor RimP
MKGPVHRKGVTVATTYETERTLQREISRRVEATLPGVEVLAVELSSATRFCVFIDHPQGVDHGLCERVSGQLRDYLDRYTVDVSSPGLERPLRTPSHFRQAVGHKVSVRTVAPVAGKTRFKGEVVSAGERTLSIATASDPVDIPYDAIVRGNLVDEGTRP